MIAAPNAAAQNQPKNEFCYNSFEEIVPIDPDPDSPYCWDQLADCLDWREFYGLEGTCDPEAKSPTAIEHQQPR
jgi:hypothetical protein